MASLVVGVALVAPPAALADEEIVATTPNTYVNPNVTIDQGERLTFRNNDFVSHDVTSTDASSAPGSVDGKLFASELISGGETSFVEGSQYLTTGSYNFICSVHTDMTGTITVTSAGTPVPRPGAGGGTTSPPADTTPPVLSLVAGTLRASKLKKSKVVPLTVGADEAATITLLAKIGSKRAGTGKVSLATGGTRKVELRLTKSGRKLLKKGRTLTVEARGTDTAGNASVAKVSKKLR